MSVERLFESAPSHWRLTTLGELAKNSGGDIQTGPFGSQLHASDYVADGIPSIMPKNISTDSVLTDDIARVSPEDIKRLAKYKVQVGDIVYSRRGDVEKCARITPREDGWLCGTGCLRVRVLPAEVSTEYLHAYLCHPSVREWIVRHAVGATMPNLNTSILSALPVYIPSEAEMNFIAATWLSISEKIQINRRINQTLEQMAQAIFQSWFVDFEPVKAKIAARDDWLARRQSQQQNAQQATESADDDAPQYSSPACYAHEFAAAASAAADQPDLITAMNRAAICVISGNAEADLDAMPTSDYQCLYHTASLFPDELVESELGEIPKGWEVKEIGDLVETVGGATPSTKNEEFWSPEEFHWTSPKDLSGISSPILLTTERRISKEGLKKISSGLLPVGSLLMSSRAPIGYLAITDIPVAINQGYIAMTPGGQLPPLYMLMWCKQYMEDIKGMANGSTFMEISKKSFRTLKAIIPSEEVIDSYLNQVDSMFKAIVSNEKEIGNLTVLRDSLLPKLLSGELDISALTDLSDNAAEPGAAHV